MPDNSGTPTPLFRTDILEFGPCIHSAADHPTRWTVEAELRIAGRYVTFSESMLREFAEKLVRSTLATRSFQARIDHPDHPEWRRHAVFIATEGTRVKITIGERNAGPTSAELSHEQVRQLADAARQVL